MANISAILPAGYADRAARRLTKCYEAIAVRVIHSEFEGTVNLAQLRAYYAGAYRELPAVQELLRRGYQQTPSADLDEDDWATFANSLHIYETCGDLTLFQPRPTPDHDYNAWVEPSAVS